LRVLGCISGRFRYVRDESRPRMCGDCVQLRRRKPRVAQQRPCVEPRRREQQHDLRHAVFGDDHHAVAATHAQFA
jgi:hypothetical protein